MYPRYTLWILVHRVCEDGFVSEVLFGECFLPVTYLLVMKRGLGFEPVTSRSESRDIDHGESLSVYNVGR